MSLRSSVGIARTGTESLRTTIPEGIVAFLDLKQTDKLDWKMETDTNNERIVIVRKIKQTGIAVDNSEKHTSTKPTPSKGGAMAMLGKPLETSPQQE